MCNYNFAMIAGFDDISMEELRLEAYQAQKQGNFTAYVSTKWQINADVNCVHFTLA